MSEWTPHVLTAAGRRLQAKVEAGLTLALTRMKLGSGQETIDEVDDLVDLVAPEVSFPISSATVKGDVCVVMGILSTANIEHGFYCREWGIFAEDPDEGEILYAILIDEKYDSIPANPPTELTITFVLKIVIANGTTVSAKIDPAGLADVDMLNAYTHALTRDTKYKAGDIVTAPTLPHGLVLEAQTDGTASNALVDFSNYICGDTFADGALTWIVKRIVVTTDADGRVEPTGESNIYVGEITIPSVGWVPRTDAAVSDEYKVQLDIEMENADETMFPQLALSVLSLSIAGDAVLCPTIKSCDGYIRLWAKRAPTADMAGVLALLSAPNNGGAGAHIFRVPADAWQELEDAESDYSLQADIKTPRSSEQALPMVAFDIASLEAAREAEICPTIQAFNGFVRLWAKAKPTENLKGTLTLLFENGVNPARLPTATDSILGGVRVKDGSGLAIDAEGNLSIKAATPEEVIDLYNH